VSDVERFDGPILTVLLEQKATLTRRRPEVLAEGDANAIEEIDATIEQITEAMTTFSLAAHNREVGRERYARWQKILPECRQAKDRLERIGIDLERAALLVQTRESQRGSAFDLIMQTRDRRPQPSDFPSALEIREHNDRERAAESVHETALARLREAKEALRVLQRNQLEANDTLNKLLFNERQLRPREEMELKPLIHAVR
jgi:hypothetical protein